MNNVDRFEVEKWFGTIEETALNFQIAIDCNILITPSSRAQSVGDCAANLLYYIRATGDTSIAKRCCSIEREGLAHIEEQGFVRCCVILTTIEDELLKRCGYSKEDGYCISDKGDTVKYCGNGENNGCVVGLVDDLLKGKPAVSSQPNQAGQYVGLVALFEMLCNGDKVRIQGKGLVPIMVKENKRYRFASVPLGGALGTYLITDKYTDTPFVIFQKITPKSNTDYINARAKSPNPQGEDTLKRIYNSWKKQYNTIY